MSVGDSRGRRDSESRSEFKGMRHRDGPATRMHLAARFPVRVRLCDLESTPVILTAPTSDQVLHLEGFVDLPPHDGCGGLGLGAVHASSHRLYVAHTANDALDVVDTGSRRYMTSIVDLPGVSGVLVSDDHDLVFSAHRGSDTIGIFPAGDDDPPVMRVGVGSMPNGFAYDSTRGLLLVANVGSPPSVSLVSVDRAVEVSRSLLPGRPGWPVFDPEREIFYVAMAEPAGIAPIRVHYVSSTQTLIPLSAGRPYGMALDPARRRLYCTCDEGRLICLDAESGRTLDEQSLNGQADVVVLDRAHGRLYVAVDDPGSIEVFAIDSLDHLQSVPTERAAHSVTLDPSRGRLFALLSESHRVAVFRVQ